MNKTRYPQEISRTFTKNCPGHDKRRSVDTSAHLLCGHGGAFAAGVTTKQVNRVPAANGWSPE